ATSSWIMRSAASSVGWRASSTPRARRTRTSPMRGLITNAFFRPSGPQPGSGAPSRAGLAEKQESTDDTDSTDGKDERSTSVTNDKNGKIISDISVIRGLIFPHPQPVSRSLAALAGRGEIV